MPTADHRRHRDALRGHRLRAAAPDVCAGRLQRGGRNLVDAGHLRQDQAARSSAEVISPASCSTAANAANRAAASSAVTWAHYVAQGKGLLDHLRSSARISSAAAWAARRSRLSPWRIRNMVASMVLYWPVGGAKYRMSSHQRFAEHLGFVRSDGLAGVVALVRQGGQTVRRRSARRTVGLRHQARCSAFADAYARAGSATHTSASAQACATRCSTATPRPAPSRKISCASTFRR